MLIRLGYDIRFKTGAEVPFIAMLNVHPSRAPDLIQPDHIQITPPYIISQAEVDIIVDALDETIREVAATLPLGGQS